MAARYSGGACDEGMRSRVLAVPACAGLLQGTVTVYPALGSAIQVRDIVITGRAAPGIAVAGPAYPLQ